jgi:hypothetical protein
MEYSTLGSSVWDLPLKELGLVRNPFSFEYVSSRPDLFSSQAMEALTGLRRWAESAARSEGGALLVGAEGSGKTIVLRALVDSPSEGSGGWATYHDASIGKGYRPEGKRDAYQERLIGDLIRKVRKKREKLLVIDNADWMVGTVRDVDSLSSGRARPSSVLGISYSTYAHAVAKGEELRDTDTYFLGPMADDSEIERKLRTSVRACSERGDPFEPDAYGEISSFSLGLPGLAADLARASLWTAGWLGATQVTKVIVARVAESLLYDVARRLLSGNRRFRGDLAEIAYEGVRRHYLQGEVRRNDLFREFSGTPGSTLNHKLRRLAMERVFFEERYGHRMRYEIPKPVRAALQVLQEQRSQKGGQGVGRELVDEESESFVV